MGQILQFIRPHDVFDSEMLIILGDAYDKTIASLPERGRPPIVRENHRDADAEACITR
jgi:hypothetical protein